MLSCLINPLTGRVGASFRDFLVNYPLLLTVLYLAEASLWATPPKLPKTRPAATLDFKQQATVPDLPRAYITSSPVDLKDGLPVGRLEVPEVIKPSRACGRRMQKGSLPIWTVC